MKYLLIYLILIFVLPPVYSQQQKKPVYYLLLDRHSHNVFFRDDPYFKERAWFLIAKDGSWTKLFQKTYKWGNGKDDRKVERKPLSFVDNIDYYSESCLLDIDSLRVMWRKSPDVSLYLLDKGTINDDSISMYQVECDSVVHQAYYFLLNSASPEIVYRESDGWRHWYFSNNKEIYFYQHRWPNRGMEDFYQVVRKPLSFLDSISYYDQNCLPDIYSLSVKLLGRDEFVYILDKDTIKNDSISMYRVVFWYEPTE